MLFILFINALARTLSAKGRKCGVRFHSMMLIAFIHSME
jgi:hypothetical protein